MALHDRATTMGPQVSFALPNGGSLTLRDSGVATATAPVMLLHGVGVTADLNWGAGYADLSRHFRVVAPDLPGHGLRSRPWPKFSIEKCADHMVALADSLAIDRFVVCGYSMGSLVAQEIWHRHPDRVAGLVLCATSRNFLGSVPERMMSSLSPIFSLAAQTNPLLRILPADAVGLGYLNDLDAETRAYVRAETGADQHGHRGRRSRGGRRVHLTPMDRGYRRPGVRTGNDAGFGGAHEPTVETRRRPTARHRHPAGRRSRCVRRVAGVVRAEGITGVSGRG
jgi:pimeloyl-ACP methyl ester carboxylesterase